MPCDHLLELTPVEPGTPDGCEECLATGGRWVHPRMCMECGHVGCCDSSPSRHATAHARGTDHPVIQSFEPVEDWAWCYLDEDAVQHVTADLRRP